ncbi:hypothetical protein V6N13_030745 [Hibiscus sabdariffa]
MTTSMAYFTLDDGEEEVLQPVNRWLRDELDDHPPGNQVAAKNLRINLPNFSINYGKNFSRDFVGDSVTLIKSTGVVSGQQSSHMDFQMGLVSKDSLMVQPECNKRVRIHDPTIEVSNQNDSTIAPLSSLPAGLQEQVRCEK